MSECKFQREILSNLGINLENQDSIDPEEKFKYLPHERPTTMDATNAALSKMQPCSEINLELDPEDEDLDEKELYQSIVLSEKTPKLRKGIIHNDGKNLLTF
jgi:hypothetical protein